MHVQAILDAKYNKANHNEVVNKLTDLNKTKKQQLLALLTKYEILLNGSLGKRNCPPVTLELKPGAVPYSAKPCPMPKIH